MLYMFKRYCVSGFGYCKHTYLHLDSEYREYVEHIYIMDIRDYDTILDAVKFLRYFLLYL